MTHTPVNVRSVEGKRRERAFQRARTRALKVLTEQHRDEFDALMAHELPIALAEIDQLGVDVRLKTGRRRNGETVTDRIRVLCEDCGTDHERGHICPHCGASPTHGPTKAIVPRRLVAPVLDESRERQQRLAELNAQIMRERQGRQSA